MQLKLDEAIRWSQGAPQRHGATRAAGRGAVCAHWGLRETAAMIRRNETKVRLPSPNNARKPGPTQLTPSPGEAARARKNYRELRETLRGCLERFIHPPEARTTFLPLHQGDLGRHVVRPICRWRPRRAAFRSTRRRSRLDLTGDTGSKRPTARPRSSEPRVDKPAQRFGLINSMSCSHPRGAVGRTTERSLSVNGGTATQSAAITKNPCAPRVA